MAEAEPAKEAGATGGEPAAAAGSSGARVLTVGGPAGPGAAGQPPPAPAARRRPVMRITSMALLLLAGIVLGFAGYLYVLSSVQESRSQVLEYARLRGELAGQVAPLGPTVPGSPVAVLDIPSIGVRNMVVVEGTSPENLTLGPGHLRDTPLPGQAGVSEIFGRRATFGGPFAGLARLRPGDVIRVVTGQGESAYTVAATADSGQTVEDPVPNRLILLTASSPFIPSHYIEVDARLTTKAHPSPGVAREITRPEFPLAGDNSALIFTIGWEFVLALVVAGAAIAAARWSPRVAYVGITPLALAVLWAMYHSLAASLPNLY
jgi:sortase A